MDSMIKTDSFEWRYQIDREHIQDIDRAIDLRDQDERSDEEEFELLEILERLPLAHDLRITVKTPTNFDVARYRSFFRKGKRYVDALAPMPDGPEPPEDALAPMPDGPEPPDDDASDLRDELMRFIDQWAMNMAVTTEIQARHMSIFEDECEWVGSDLLERWSDPEIYIAEVPPALHVAWSTASMAISPGTFGTGFFPKNLGKSNKSA